MDEGNAKSATPIKHNFFYMLTGLLALFISTGAIHEQFPEFAYHSFVTLTTLGYGDITPATPIARALVGMHISSHIDSKNNADSED